MTENRHYKALELDKILAMLAEQTAALPLKPSRKPP